MRLIPATLMIVVLAVAGASVYFGITTPPPVVSHSSTPLTLEEPAPTPFTPGAY